MKEKLDHKNYKYKSFNRMALELDHICESLEQKHHMQRKINFLLDIRGYLFMNKIVGNYIELGSYKSEMQYCAYKILNPSECIEKFIGVDAFEEKILGTKAKQKFNSSYRDVKTFVDLFLGEKGALVKGDLRKTKIADQCVRYSKFNVAVIDCNLPSSIEASLEIAVPNMASGGVLFIDDYLLNFDDGKPKTEILFRKAIKKHAKNYLEHSFYAPFAKSYIIY